MQVNHHIGGDKCVIWRQNASDAAGSPDTSPPGRSRSTRIHRPIPPPFPGDSLVPLPPMKAALRRVGFGSGPLTGSLRWRRRLLLAALVASAAAAVLIAFSSRPSGAALWLSDSYSTPSSRSADSLSSANFSPTSPPDFASRLNFSASAVTPVPPPVLAPSSSPNDDLDDAEVDHIDSGPGSKETDLWTGVMNSTDANLPSLSVETHPSQLESSKSGTPELREPSLSFQNELRMPMPLTFTDQQLIYAKGEISRAPVIYDHPDLFAPLFLNVSVFKRSYTLMESMLKVYIYQDGSKPIFHRPDLKGIYASEGWFMKLMQDNKNFVVKNPKKAHLFYLPYSAHRLQQTLYTPNSHNFQPLMIFLRDYIDMISVKYPFWNRTRGADHFLVACHDWGPYTTKWHHELRANAIKALCNADVSEGVFIRRKDVSLPETSIRNARRPLWNIGGKPASQRTILAFFAGQMHGRVRPILLQYWSGKDNDMKIYGPLPERVARKMSYVDHMKSSKYCICPMGYEVNSPRIVEAIYYECVPVIIADNFVLPFEEVLDWSAFSVVVAEKDIPNLKDIILRIPQAQYVTMQMNVKKLQKHFLWHAKPVKYDIFHMILHSIWFNRLNQIQAEQL